MEVNRVKVLRAQRDDILDKIKNWRRYNSQSNPGAVKELRELQKDLLEVERKLRWMGTLVERTVSNAIVVSDGGGENGVLRNSQEPPLVLRT